MKNFEEMTMEELKALYDEKVKQETFAIEKLRRWRAEVDETYWYVDAFGVIHDVTEYYNKVDNYLYNTGNYFQTRKQAEEYKKKLILQQEYKDWCRFNCDWKNKEQIQEFIDKIGEEDFKKYIWM